jgi:hypothetical protein
MLTGMVEELKLHVLVKPFAIIQIVYGANNQLPAN